MRTIFTTVFLILIFLSAGAFASNAKMSHPLAMSGSSIAYQTN